MFTNKWSVLGFPSLAARGQRELQFPIAFLEGENQANNPRGVTLELHEAARGRIGISIDTELFWITPTHPHIYMDTLHADECALGRVGVESGRLEEGFHAKVRNQLAVLFETDQ